ncbi:hypothetical protein PTB13_20660, partial [Bacillus sp. MHSD17]|nr:hypothetical protein [Bacillus sp. MHSD17]
PWLTERHGYDPTLLPPDALKLDKELKETIIEISTFLSEHIAPFLQKNQLYYIKKVLYENM